MLFIAYVKNNDSATRIFLDRATSPPHL